MTIWGSDLILQARSITVKAKIGTITATGVKYFCLEVLYDFISHKWKNFNISIKFAFQTQSTKRDKAGLSKGLELTNRFQK